MNEFQILMGSNTNAVENTVEATRRLSSYFPVGIRFSASVESVAVSKSGKWRPEAAPYRNTLCLAQTDLDKEQTTAILKEIERAMGRAEGSVVIDLDLVVWNGTVLRPWETAQDFYKACLETLVEGH